MNIKIRYFVVMGIITAIFTIVEVNIYQSGDPESWNRILQVFAGTVALVSGVIALAVADSKTKKVDFDITVFANRVWREEYITEELDSSIKPYYKNHGENFYSYRVNFEIQYKSKFSLEEPTLTFRLPSHLKHPDEEKKNRIFRTNIYNETKKIQELEFGNTHIISSSNLPYLNNGDRLKIWIRMCLIKDSDFPFILRVSLNGKNAEGRTIKIKKMHKDLFSKSLINGKKKI